MRSLSASDLKMIHDLHNQIGAGDFLTTAAWNELIPLQNRLATELGIMAGDPPSAFEPFARISDVAGAEPLIGPRWWFHLLGVRHGAVHVVLTTPQGWFVIQRRSRLKDDMPGALDIAVTGHIGISEPLAAAWSELAEELGIHRVEGEDGTAIEENTLHYFDTYDTEDLRLEKQNPPVVNRERVWVYHARLTSAGLACLHFADGEVSSLLFVGPGDLQHMVERCRAGKRYMQDEIPLATGLLNTLPRWIARA
jgi:isopentenyldiphosphate isomerase